ncbi:Homeobox-leucine zipper protein ATHB-40 [Vitis vinifera]|uniref:Homeobox-leucine zipper protein n=1 Tax=Vitis vinifera TaxID=29760 RepID=A0A438CIT2_VITVI|nr:Homeobox-leucine zipper protein ATHB-40 [Vitis vinifera]
MTTAMNQQVQDHMELFTHMYPGLYTQAMPEQGEAKVRRRRKKSKGESSSGCARKRKLSEEQVTHLELNFGNEHKLESERKDKIASELGLDPDKWPSGFRTGGLAGRVLTLKEQLSDAEKEIRRLSERSDGVSSNSPTSSLSNAVDVDPPFFGEFGVVDGLDNVFYIPENNYVSGMEWGYLYDM